MPYYFNKWVTFAAACLLQATGGLGYSFAVFAPALKNVFGYTEENVALIGSSLNFGGYLAIVSGFLYDRLEIMPRLGPRLVVWIGAVLVSIGFSGLYACAAGVAECSYWRILLFAFIGGNGSTYFDTASLVTNVRNFPHHRGTAVGILKSFVGLSASIYASLFAAMAHAPAVMPPQGGGPADHTDPSSHALHGSGVLVNATHGLNRVHGGDGNGGVMGLPALLAGGVISDGSAALRFAARASRKLLAAAAFTVAGATASTRGTAGSGDSTIISDAAEAGSDGGDADAIAFLRCIAVWPSLLALVFSLGFNLVPEGYRSRPHEHEAAAVREAAETQRQQRRQQRRRRAAGVRTTAGSSHIDPSAIGHVDEEGGGGGEGALESLLSGAWSGDEEEDEQGHGCDDGAPSAASVGVYSGSMMAGGAAAGKDAAAVVTVGATRASGDGMSAADAAAPLDEEAGGTFWQRLARWLSAPQQQQQEQRNGSTGWSSSSSSSSRRRRQRARQRADCMTTQGRFLLVYALVAVLALYQLTGSLYSASHHLNDTVHRGMAAALLGMVCLLLLLPMWSGECVHVHVHAPEVHVPCVGARDHHHPHHQAQQQHGHQQGTVTHIGHGHSGERGGESDGDDGDISAPTIDAAGGVSRTDVNSAAIFTGGNAVVSNGHAEEVTAAAGYKAEDMEGNEEGNAVCCGDDDDDNEVEDTPAEVSPSAALRTRELWLLAVQFGIGLGSGLALINNVGSLVLALGGRPGGQVVYVSLFSVANASGRLLGGYVSEALMHSQRHVPRPALLLFSSLVMVVAQAGLASASLADLYVCCLLAGLSFGAHWSLVPAITSDIFGLSHFGANYTMLQLGPAVCGYLLATRLTGSLADRAAKAHGDTARCIGADCYATTFAVLSALNLLAATCTWALLRHTRPAYQRLLAHARAQAHRR